MNKRDDLSVVRQLMSNQFKILEMKLDVLSKRKGYKRIAISSSIAGEGKTLLSTSLSRQLAASGKKVLLVDADIRKPDVAKTMNIKPAPGLSEYLCGDLKADELVMVSDTKGLHVIPGGTPEPSRELAASGKFFDLIKSMDGAYDYVVIDTPPVVPVLDTMYIKNCVDGILFVFRLSYTPLDLFRKSIEDVGREKIIGAVLNYANYDNVMHGKYYKYYSYGYRPSEKKGDVTDKAVSRHTT